MSRTFSPLEFKLIRIPGRIDDELNIKQIIKKAIDTEIGIQPVNYNEFKNRTTRGNVKRYIMAARGEFRQYLKEMQHSFQEGKPYDFIQDLNRGQFELHNMPMIKRSDDDPSRADRKYGIIDIHKIDIRYDQDGKDPDRKKSILDKVDEYEDTDEEFRHSMEKAITHDQSWIINICLNPNIPIITFELLSAIALRISRISKVEVLALEMVPSGPKKLFWEHYSEYDQGAAVKKITKPYGNHLFTEYRKYNGIEIRKTLAEMDANIDVSMAPHDLEELRIWWDDFTKSKEYMNSTGLNKTEVDEYERLIDDIKQLSGEIEKTTKMLYMNSDVESTYIKINDPRKLSKFKWRSLTGTNEGKLN